MLDVTWVVKAIKYICKFICSAMSLIKDLPILNGADLIYGYQFRLQVEDIISRWSESASKEYGFTKKEILEKLVSDIWKGYFDECLTFSSEKINRWVLFQALTGITAKFSITDMESENKQLSEERWQELAAKNVFLYLTDSQRDNIIYKLTIDKNDFRKALSKSQHELPKSWMPTCGKGVKILWKKIIDQKWFRKS